MPRFIVLSLIALLATATLTFAAENRPAKAVPQAAPTQASPRALVVPEVRNQVYVFAKGTLEEAGFAWKVTGSVAGYSANRVVAQSPAPGTRVLDTGAPTISLSLSVNRGYPQKGDPENASLFRGTAIQLADTAANRVVVPKAKPKKLAAPKRKASPKKQAPKKKQAPAPKPKVRPKAKPNPKPQPKIKGKRPPAFAVPGARPEPQDELALPDRARLLGVWLSSHRKPSDANVQHWLYQHAWIVEGARMGWWHGAEALETLIRVDEHVQALWGIGAKSEAVARTALVDVRSKAR
ncbi:MAG: PASTA domain-containing protein [Actinomycetota bacterium]|nr:PASTA domain-containing protein [Actinomycetota bacterium]